MNKRFFSLILAIILVLSMALPVTAAEYNSSYVGYLTIYAANSGNSNWEFDLGHAFLGFENISGSTITFGQFPVPDDGGVTISVWRNINGKSGIIYNADSYLHYEKGRYSNRVSITMPITQSELNTINNYINQSANDRYDVSSYNCVNFCVNVWYLVAYHSFTIGSPASPHILYNSITQFNEHETGAMVPNNSTVGYYRSGSWVTIPHGVIVGNSSLGTDEPEVDIEYE